MAKINSQIKEVDGKLDDCEQAIKESIASKQAYCASLVNLDKVSLYKYQIKNNAFDEQKQRLYEKKSSLSNVYIYILCYCSAIAFQSQLAD